MTGLWIMAALGTVRSFTGPVECPDEPDVHAPLLGTADHVGPGWPNLEGSSACDLGHVPSCMTYERVP